MPPAASLRPSPLTTPQLHSRQTCLHPKTTKPSSMCCFGKTSIKPLCWITNPYRTMSSSTSGCKNVRAMTDTKKSASGAPSLMQSITYPSPTSSVSSSLSPIVATSTSQYPLQLFHLTTPLTELVQVYLAHTPPCPHSIFGIVFDLYIYVYTYMYMYIYIFVCSFLMACLLTIRASAPIAQPLVLLCHTSLTMAGALSF